MIYTGNNGRIYIARSQTSGLTVGSTFTRTILPGIGPIYKNGQYPVFNIEGAGRGAVVRADQTIQPNDTIRECQFTVVVGGEDYYDGDLIKFSWINPANGVIVDLTGGFRLSGTKTAGVDSEREILQEKYRIAKIRNWNFTSNSEVIETTSLGDVTKSFSPSVTSGEGSATLMFYEDTYGQTDANLDIFELVNVLFPRSAPPRVVMNLAVDGSVAGSSFDVGGNALWKTNFMFNAYITSASVGVSYGEVVTVDTSFTVDGPLIDVPWKRYVDRI